MRAPTHILGGATFWLAACIPVHAAADVVLFGAATAGYCAPWCDLDNLGAWSKRRKLGKGLLARRITVRRRPVKRLASWTVTRFGSHRRGPAHSLWAGAAAGVLFLLPLIWLPTWPAWAAAAAALGVASHPLLDLLNDKPVALLWPLPLVQPLCLMRVGGKGETLFQIFLAAAGTAALLACAGRI